MWNHKLTNGDLLCVLFPNVDNDDRLLALIGSICQVVQSLLYILVFWARQAWFLLKTACKYHIFTSSFPNVTRYIIRDYEGDLPLKQTPLEIYREVL